MTPEEVYDRQQTLTRSLTRQLLPLIAPLVGSKVSRSALALLVRAFFPVVAASREKQAALAEEYYRGARERAGVPGEPVSRPETREYAEEALSSGLERVISEDEVLSDEAAASAVLVADTHSRNAYRNTVMAYSRADPRIRGWARIDPKPPTCPFCRMLISRGPVYSTAESAGERNKFHRGDTCVPTLVFQGQEDSYDGVEQTRAAKALWEESEGNMKAFRKLVTEENSGGKLDSKDDLAERAAREAKKADEKRAAQRKSLEARLNTLRNLNPKSQSAKDYKAAQLERLTDELQRLDAGKE